MLYARIENGAVVDQLRLSAEDLATRTTAGEDWRPVVQVEPTTYPGEGQQWKRVLTINADHVVWEDQVENLTGPAQVAARAEQRRRAYLAAGVNLEAMIVALWEKEVENRPGAALALQASREAIKAQIP